MIELWNDKKKRYLILFSSLAFLLAAHSYRWMNAMYAHDSLTVIQDDAAWQISLGRIWNPLYVWLRGRIVAPGNVALFASAFLILSSALVIRTLRLEKPLPVVLCCGFLATFETLAFVNGMFLLSLDLDMLALLFAALAAWFLTGPKRVWRYAAGVVSVAAMLGLFQSYIEVTILLVCLELLRETLEGGDAKKLFLKGLCCSGLLVLGGILYFLCLSAVLKATGIAPAETSNGLVKMKTLTVPSVLSLSWDAWKSTLRYLFFQPAIAHPELSRWGYCILGLLSVSGIVRIAVKKRLGAGSLALAAFLLLIMPLGGNAVHVLSLGFKHSLMNYSFVFFSVLAVMVFDMAGADGSAAVRIARRAFPLLCAVLLLNHVLFANQWYTRNDLSSRAGISFMTRLVTHMEETEGYETGRTPILILGHVDENPEAYRSEGLRIADDPWVGTNHSLAVSYYGTYEHMFRYILNYPVNMVPLGEVAGYLDDPGIRAMPVYPERGSVRMVDGVLVIRLSEDLRPEELR